MKNSMWPMRRRAARIFRPVCLALLCLGATASGGPRLAASETPATRIAAAYDFSIGGLSIGEATLEAEAAPGRYKARARMTTRGALEIFLKGGAESRAEGLRDGAGAFDPRLYETRFSAGRAEAQTLIMALEGATPVSLSLDPPDAKPVDFPVRPEEQMGVLDPVSAILASFLPQSEAAVCDRTVPVFDGRRRYDVMFTRPAEGAKVAEAPAPEWPSPLTHCLGVYERIAGFAPEALRDERYYLFDVWFEKADDGVWRPVRVAGRTRLGYAIGDLRPMDKPVEP